MEEWKIERSRRKCEACSKGFGALQDYYSGITELQETFTRKDYCPACWNPQRETYYSFWKTAAPPPTGRPKENVEVILDFFKKLALEKDLEPEKSKLRYLTALLLMRRKRLKLVRTDHRDGQDIMVLEKSWDGEPMDLPAPAIDETELNTLKLKIQELLDMPVNEPT